MAERFHLGAILSVTTDIFVAPDGFGDVHRLLEHMCGEPLWTHQLIRAGAECKPHLLAQFPQLAEVVPPEFVNVVHVWEWLAVQVAAFGEWHDVEPMAAEDHTSIDPLTEMALLAPQVEVIPVSTDGEVTP